MSFSRAGEANSVLLNPLVGVEGHFKAGKRGERGGRERKRKGRKRMEEKLQKYNSNKGLEYDDLVSRCVLRADRAFAQHYFFF